MKRPKLSHEPSSDVEHEPASITLKRESQPETDIVELVAKGVRTTPFTYQRACIHFASQTKNVALLDDMGLGKTFQVLCIVRAQPPPKSFFEDASKAKRFRGNTLIVCPKIVLEQWASEYEKHLAPLCGAHTPFLYHAKTASKTTIPMLCSHEIVVTTYDFLMSKTKRDSSVVSIQWWRVVLDEVHCVKNHASRRFEVIDSLECARRIVLSGTPLHNNLTNVFPILRFFGKCKGSLDQAFTEWQHNVSFKMESKNAQRKSEAIEYVKAMLYPHVIRRLKTGTWKGNPLIDALPKKSYATIEVPMNAHERKVYESIEEGFIKDGILEAAGDDIKGSDAANAFGKLLSLRMCCVDSSLCIDKRNRALFVDSTCAACELGSNPMKEFSCGCIVCDMCCAAAGAANEPANCCCVCDGPKGKGVRIKIPSVQEVVSEVQSTRPTSSKLAALETHLKSYAGDKTIVFSSWTSVLDSIERSCQTIPKHVRVDGSMSQMARMNAIREFKDGEAMVLLMTLGAGSTGLDLKCANRVVFVDPHWSPAIEMQAEDRAYRIGQTKPVIITHLIQMCEGKTTIEQIVRNVQRAKKRQMHSMFPMHE